MTLSSLPLELLQQIVACIENVYRPSLYELSLTSKACHTASAYLIFRGISITVLDRSLLQQDTDKLLDALSRTDSARHVQRIYIKGDIRLNVKKINMFGQEYGPQRNWLEEHGLNEILVDEEPLDYSENHVVYDEPVIQKASPEDMAWNPIVSLLGTLPCLRDLIYDCQSQFPPSILDALRQQQPQCRLHHLSFRFRTLLWGVPYPYEMELATYPALYRIRVGCARRDTNGDDDFNEEAMMELAAGLAPGLKEVTILSLFPCHSNRLRRVRDSWLSLPHFTGKQLGNLMVLKIKGYSDLSSPEFLQKWVQHTDFTCLQELTLGGSHQAKSSGLTGETLDWVAQNCLFPQLRTLNVWLDRDDMFHERPQYSENAVSFFSVFYPLERLTVKGPIDVHAVEAILSCHGPRLKMLSLHPLESDHNISNARPEREIPLVFTKGLIEQIQVQCPQLEELSIPVKRNQSSASEAEIYKHFGKMTQLRHLFLNLDCSNWRVMRDDLYNPQYVGEDQMPALYDTVFIDDQEVVLRPSPVKVGELKATFINAAVDETLARSIWTTISNNKTGKRLDCLKLWTTGAGSWSGWAAHVPGVDTFVQDLSRSWLIERAKRDGDEEITVRELGKQWREREQRNVTSSHRLVQGKVFHAIWPRKENSNDWRDDWSSFPLQV